MWHVIHVDQYISRQQVACATSNMCISRVTWSPIMFFRNLIITGTWSNFSIGRTANRHLEALYNGLPFTLTHFFENILEFVWQTFIIAMVCVCFYWQSDVTLLKEFQQCLNSRYLASTSFSRCLHCELSVVTARILLMNIRENG